MFFFSYWRILCTYYMTSWYNRIRTALELVSFSQMLRCFYVWLPLSAIFPYEVRNLQKWVYKCEYVLSCASNPSHTCPDNSMFIRNNVAFEILMNPCSSATIWCFAEGKHDVVLGTFEMYSPVWSIRVFVMLRITKLSARVQLQLQN